MVVPTPDYVRFAGHYRFRPDFCHARDPESKGIVENLVNYAKHDLMIPMTALQGPVGLAEATPAAGGETMVVRKDVPLIVGNLGPANQLIGTLRRAGCAFALDDFGSGVSSFAYVKALGADLLGKLGRWGEAAEAYGRAVGTGVGDDRTGELVGAALAGEHRVVTVVFERVPTAPVVGEMIAPLDERVGVLDADRTAGGRLLHT